ncbi:MAG TPA: LytTR family DNA-binding domain-containing protein [Steroidobacteraceae bacterium]|jgi:two-component system, LytTR family, response regulator|nr:LytTR family DNA-binding domain-containing protein [Steroidobacteraceae bacterium]HJY42114.1 LytTR family DNA-binding domain-containing protein [Steroidobacteraceae bacterium]
MTALRVIAIDDEPLALRRLEWCLQDVPDVALVGKTGNPQRGLELIRTLAPDVVLLDVEMPELSGFELIDALGTLDDAPMPEIVFVTAFDHFAVKAFAVSVVDYLLKPVERNRLIEALERARVRRELRDAQARVQELREIIDNLRVDRRSDSQKRYETELWIREGDARVRVPVEMIERLEADGDYVRLHVGQRVRLMRARLGDLAERLDPARFVRVHRSEIVRHDLISAIRRHESGRTFAVLAGGREVPVSRRYVSRVAHALRFRKQQHSMS